MEPDREGRLASWCQRLWKRGVYLERWFVATLKERFVPFVPFGNPPTHPVMSMTQSFGEMCHRRDKATLFGRHMAIDTIFLPIVFALGVFFFGVEPAHEMACKAFALWVVTSQTDIAQGRLVFFDRVWGVLASNGTNDNTLALFVAADMTGCAGDRFFL